jgi:EAL domain-containing protein (putative c-di-GMP-specific phosphodiesterase class I)/integral membrane sensor domain MASE1
MPPRFNARVWVFATLAVMASALLSQELSFSDLAFSLFWPPAGIAFALIWHFGRRALPAVAVGIAVPTLLFYPGWGSVLVIVGETCGPWAGVALLRRLRQRNPALDSPLQWQLAFYACGLLVTCPVAALLGSLGAVAEHRFELTGVPGLFLAYTMVESIGLVLFAPPVIDWLTRDSRRLPFQSSSGTQRHWLLVVPVGIEAARWLLFANVSGDYANILIYCYFPLVAWCALTETARRTNVLLVLTAVVVLSSEAWRLQGAASPNASFGLFRFALVILTLSATGQLLAALASERRIAFAELARQMELDPLTGLLNERSFARALDEVTRPFKIVLVAFDNWPEFEILAGIGASYDLQLEVTEIMRSQPALLHVSRLQAGSFACIVADEVEWPDKLEHLLRRRWSTRGVEMRLIGVALRVSAQNPSVAGELLLGARTVLNEARFSGVDTPLLRHWSTSLIAERRAHELLVDSIKHAVRAGRLRLYAQPIAQACPGRRPSVEILVRVETEEGELLNSADVAHVLSQNLISTELDRVVIKTAFEWFALHKEMLEAVDRVAINLSGASLSAPTLFEWIEHCRTSAGLAANSFAFEVTESQAILNFDLALTLVESLRGAGYLVALDDFGTGLATFDYLKRFAVDYIKIDGSFIRNLAESPIDLEIVTGIVRLARLMGIGTVAEYVSDDAIGRAALGAGVEALQGYAISPPLPLAEALELCRTDKAVLCETRFAATPPLYSGIISRLRETA